MKKTIIACTILSTLHALANAAPPTNDESKSAVSSMQTPATPTTTQNATMPNTSTQTPPAPSTTSTTQPAQPAQATLPDNLDCNYQLSTQVTEVDSQLVKKWAEKAAEQSFTFDASQLESQIEKLKACFTPQGWQGFYDALKKSGNLTAITNQGLNVSSMVDGASSITQNKSNEWKLTIPLEVVYQNKQQKLTQSLSLEVLVGRKVSGDLGIMQIVAAPKNATDTSSSVPANSTPPTDAATGGTPPVSAPAGSTSPTGAPSDSSPSTAGTPPTSQPTVGTPPTTTPADSIPPTNAPANYPAPTGAPADGTSPTGSSSDSTPPTTAPANATQPVDTKTNSKSTSTIH